MNAPAPPPKNRTPVRGFAAPVWLALVAMLALAARAEPPARPRLTGEEEIARRVDQARATMRAGGGRQLRPRLGATHYDGRYFLTKEPYLLEGAKAIDRLGFRIAKFWFNPRGLGGYGFHSDWGIPGNATLVELARHPYYREAFELPFSVIVLEVTSLGPHGNRIWLEDPAHLAEVEAQLRELTRYLLEAYRDREVTFVLQNWEGDWMAREGAKEGGAWPTGDAERRFAAMRDWFAARQRGVEAGRRAIGRSKARVCHAIEVNKVLESLQGVPTLTTQVLPKVDTDLVSWSCYDGAGKVKDLWRGVEVIRHYSRPRADGRKPPVYIGEIGHPENVGSLTESGVRDWWEDRLAAFVALDIPWIVHWELYCNEPKDGRKGGGRVCTADELRGFWLLRPDGSLSHAGRYFAGILQGAVPGAAAPEK